MKHSSQRPVLPGMFMVQIQELPTAPFDGATFQPEKDQARLGEQLQRVLDVLHHREWVSLAEIKQVTGDPEASISARIRDLRKPKFGGYQVEHRRRDGAGLWEYQLRKDV